MNPIRKAALYLGAKMAAVGGGITFSLTDSNVGKYLNALPTISGKVVNDETTMRVTTAFACVRVIAETIGAVTLAVYERKENGNAERVDHELSNILVNKPNQDMTGMVYREAMGTNLAARGNALSVITRNASGSVSQLYPVPWARVRPKMDATTDWQRVYEIEDRGKLERFPADKVWHWKGFGYDGLQGLSPIGCAREAIGLAMGGEEAQARLFSNGLSASAVVSIPQFLKPEQRKQAEEILAKMHQGLQNFGKPYLLEGGMKVEEGVFAPRDAQFLELRRFQIGELCRLWRISPHMVADLERATNNNIEQLSSEFVMYTMSPYFRRIEEEAQQLFKPEERARYFVRFNYESLLRADSAARASLYSILLQNGVYNRNEVRSLENRNASDAPGMNDFTVQSNMISVDDLQSVADAMRNRGSQP
jgi:HK97 family phage portal protein